MRIISLIVAGIVCISSTPALAQTYMYRHTVDSAIMVGGGSSPDASLKSLLLPETISLPEITDGTSPGICTDVLVQAVADGVVTSLSAMISSGDTSYFEVCIADVNPCQSSLAGGESCNMGVRSVATRAGTRDAVFSVLAEGAAAGETTVSVTTSGYGHDIYGFAAGSYLPTFAESGEVFEVIDASKSGFIQALAPGNGGIMAYGLYQDGTIWRIGADDVNSSTTWVQDNPDSDWLKLFSSQSGHGLLAIKENGTTWAYGLVSRYVGTYDETRRGWIEIPNGQGIVDIVWTMGYSAMGFKADGTAMLWGDAGLTRGVDPTLLTSQWVEVDAGVEPLHNIIGGARGFGLGLDSSGSLWAMGTPPFRGGDQASYAEWTDVGWPERWSELVMESSSGVIGFYGILNDGTIWSKDISGRSGMSLISAETDWVSLVFCPYDGLYALNQDGELYTFKVYSGHIDSVKMGDVSAPPSCTSSPYNLTVVLGQ